MKKLPLLQLLAIGLISQAGAQTTPSDSTRPNSFMIQSFQAGSTTDIDYIIVKDLDSDSVVYRNDFSEASDSTKGLSCYYEPQGAMDTNYVINGPMTSVVDGKLRLQCTGFNQNGWGGYESHTEAYYTNRLPRNFYVEISAKRLQWPGHFHFHLYREDPLDKKYGYVSGGAFATNRASELPLEVARMAASGSWFQEYGILSNLNDGTWSQQKPAPTGNLMDAHTMAMALSNNVVTFYLDGAKLNSLTNTSWTNYEKNVLFDFGYKSLDDTNSSNYIISTQNMQKYSEWQSPPVTYWGLSSNNSIGLLTMEFPITKNAKQVALIANLAAFNFNNPSGYFGSGSGSNSLWASKDKTNWMLLINNSTPSQVDSYKTYSNNIPTNVLGSGTLYLQVRSLTSGAPIPSYSDAQFSRSSANSTTDVFHITAYSSRQISQQIKISPISPIAYSFNKQPISLEGYSSSGLPLSYSVISGPGTIVGTKLYISGSGTITVKATQVGNASYESAETTASIIVNKANQVISFPSITFNASASSGLGINYKVISGNASITSNTLKILGSGSIVVVASQNGNSNYNMATNITNILIVPDRR